MGESFRLLKGIAGFVNHVFSKIMGERISVHEVEYKPIIDGREVDDDGVVENLVVKKEDSKDGRSEELEEARFVGRRILSLLQDEDVYVYKNGEWEIDDFKTDDISLDEIDVRRKEYEVQLSIYSYLLSKLCPKQKVLSFLENPLSNSSRSHTANNSCLDIHRSLCI